MLINIYLIHKIHDNKQLKGNKNIIYKMVVKKTMKIII